MVCVTQMDRIQWTGTRDEPVPKIVVIEMTGSRNVTETTVFAIVTIA